MSELVTPTSVDRRLFSLHEEEDLVEITPHRRQVSYFETNLRVLLLDRFVGANLGVYWVPGQLKKPWAGPDVLVASRPTRDPMPRVWVVWEDGPLHFVAEVASDETRRLERKKRDETYRDALAVPEYLYVDLDRHQLELWRLEAGEYRAVRPENGRLYSEQLGVRFGWEPEQGFVRIWADDGQMLPTSEERQQRYEEEQRLRQEEQRLRQEEQRLRQAAEQRAAEEAAARREAEERVAALAAELERLRRGD